MKHALCLFHFVFCSLVSRGCLCGEWKEMWRRSACFLFTTLPLLLHILFPLIPHPITQEIHLGYLLWLGDTLRSETQDWLSPVMIEVDDWYRTEDWHLDPGLDCPFITEVERLDPGVVFVVLCGAFRLILACVPLHWN